jgi:hypothetical protein
MKFFQHKILLYILTFTFPLLLYINTIPNNYALDDSIVITENVYVKEGISGIKKIFANDTFTGFFQKKKDLVEGSRYRPLSIASYAVEYSIWKYNPHISHFINAILYSLLCLTIYFFLIGIMRFFNLETHAMPVALISTLLFAVHPVHTEVVANIKGRDEILALIFSIMALYLFLKYLNKSRIMYAVASAISLLLGLLSKENTLAMIAVAGVLVLLTYRKAHISKYISGMIFLCLGALVYLYIRIKVTGGLTATSSSELMNNPFFYAKENEKLPTVLYTLLLYLKLLIFPQPLTYDYYPYHIELQSWHGPLIIISLFVHLCLVFVAFWSFRKQKVVSFAIFFYLLTLLPVSNLFINIGSFMNERFVFFSSLGFCLLASYSAYSFIIRPTVSPYIKKIILFVCAILFILFGAKTISRNSQWKDNFTLFLHDVQISSGSAKGNCAAGGILLEKVETENIVEQKTKYLNQSVQYLTKALKIYPNYVDALLLLGNAYYFSGKDFDKTLTCYAEVFRLAPGYDMAFDNLKKMLTTTEKPVYRKKGYGLLLKYRIDDFDANYQLGVTYGKQLNKLDSAVIYLIKAVQIKPDSKEANRDMGVALAMGGKTEMALPYFEKTLKLEPEEFSNYINLGITYQKLGYVYKADEFFRKAEELKRQQKTKK